MDNTGRSEYRQANWRRSPVALFEPPIINDTDFKFAMIRPPNRSQPAVYADYQGSTPLDRRVAQNIANYFEEQCANPHAKDHALGWEAAAKVDRARRAIAGAVGADSDEIIFTSGATEANNLAILGLAETATSTRNRILVSSIEHKSILAAARAAQTLGCRVELVPVDRWGRVELSELEDRLDDTVLAISVGLVNGEIGSRQDLKAIAALTDRIGAFLHADAAQALVDQTINLHELGVTAASFSSHKIYGPQGVGALFVKRDWQSRVSPRIHGGGQENGLRSGTLPVALCRAFADAVELTCGPLAEIERERVKSLRDRFADGMMALPGVTLNGPPLAQRHVGNCNIRIEGHVAKDVLLRLQPRLAASTGAACSSGLEEPSHVLTAIGLTQEEAEASVRLSFGRFSTKKDVDLALAWIGEVLGAERAITKLA